MGSLSKAIQWLGYNKPILRKSDSDLETTGLKRCESHYGIMKVSTSDNGYITNVNRDEQGASNELPDTGMIPTKRDKAAGLKILHSKRSFASLTSGQTQKQISGELCNNISPLDFKTLVIIPVIPGLPGVKVVEIKPDPENRVSPPVSLGIVRSSTTRLNEISPPCHGETGNAVDRVRNPVDVFNRRRLKEKSASFTGVEIFQQKQPKVLQRTKSDRLMNDPGSREGGLQLTEQIRSIRKTVSNSEALQETHASFRTPNECFKAAYNENYLNVSDRTVNGDRILYKHYHKPSMSSVNSTRSVGKLSTSSLAGEAPFDQSLPISEKTDIEVLDEISMAENNRHRALKCSKRNKTDWDFYTTRCSNAGIFDARETKMSRIDALMKSFRKRMSPKNSRLSLFSITSGKRRAIDKAPVTKLLHDSDKVSKRPSTDLNTSPKHNDAKGHIIDENRPKLGKLQKQMSFGEHHMRTAQLELSKNSIFTNQDKEDLGRIQFIVHYSESVHALRVTALKASGIQKPRKCSKSTRIFTTVSLKPGKYKKLTSQKVEFTDNPEFREDFDFSNISDTDTRDMQLKITLYRKDASLKFPKFNGKAYVSLADYNLNIGKPIWKALEPKQL